MKRSYQVAAGAVLVLIALFFLASILGYHAGDYARLVSGGTVKNTAGQLGAWTGHFLRTVFGEASYGLPVLLFLSGLSLTRDGGLHRATEQTALVLALTVSLSALCALFVGGIPQQSGGRMGACIAGFLISLFGRETSYLIISGTTILIAIGLVFVFVLPKREMIEMGDAGVRGFVSRLPFLRSKQDMPLLDLGMYAFPWIVKKRILVLETEKTERPVAALGIPDLMERSAEPDDCRDDGMGQDMLLLEQHDGTGECDEVDREVILSEEEYHIDEGSAQAIDDRADNDELTGDAESDDSDSLSNTHQMTDGDNSDTLQYEDDDSRIADLGRRVFGEIPINEEYIIPTLYLTLSRAQDSESWKTEIRKNSQLLKSTLAEFGIEADVVNVNRGPVITLYEMQIAPGIKVTRVASLADDIAMALAASRVRIVAPIPGKSAIGVEIPNRYRETVTLGDIVKSKEFQSFEGSLVVALGKDILGNPVMLDLKRLPHLLIAGSTGSGKSVCVNSIITSLLYRYDPNYLRFILIDPKMVELQLYNGLPHLLTPVIVDPHVAPMVLKWTMHEMERRYRLLSAVHTRDIERYNKKMEQSGLAERLPYIVTIIDEMADLMMTSKEVEGCITRIAQKARAVGIHLVVATQRPSVDIITGIIKANFPARVAFQVAQKTDSRTIIDQNGAEKLLGRGDMLYQSPTSSFPIRIQGGYISEEEIDRIVGHCKCLGAPAYIDIEESLQNDEEARDEDGAGDELFREALKIVEETKKASASYLQRRLSIGYNRAARIVEQMEEMGYIGPQIGSKPRDVYV